MVRAHENPAPKLPSVIVGYPSAQVARLAHSQSLYTQRKMEKALASIAEPSGESILHKAGSALKHLKDRSAKQIGLVCRYLGLEFIAKAIKQRLLPKMDIVHAKVSAFKRADMLNELKGVQSTQGVRMLIQPHTTESSPCVGQADYDYDSAWAMSDQEVRSAAHRAKMMKAICDMDLERAKRDRELREHYTNNRNAEEMRNAQERLNAEKRRDAEKRRAASTPGHQKFSKGGVAFYYQLKPVTENTQQAKAAMNAKMNRRQIRADITKAARLLSANNK